MDVLGSIAQAVPSANLTSLRLVSRRWCCAVDRLAINRVTISRRKLPYVGTMGDALCALGTRFDGLRELKIDVAAFGAKFPATVVVPKGQVEQIKAAIGAPWLGDPTHIFGLVQSLTALDLSYTLVGSEVFAQLSAFAKLRHLDLSRTGMESSSLAGLAGLTRLTELNLEGCKRVGDQGMAALATLTALISIDLSNTSAGDDGAMHLSCLTCLRSFIATGTGIGTEGISHLSACTGLTCVRIHQTGYAGQEDAALLLAHSQLRCLFLGSCKQITNLHCLSSLTHLTALNLNIPHTGAEGLTFLPSLSGLTSLDLSCVDLGDALGFTCLGALTGLTWLDLDATSLTNEDVAELEHLTALRALSLAEVRISKDGIANLSSLSALEELNLAGTLTTSDAITLLVVLTRLRSINLCYTPLFNKGIWLVASLSGLKSLDLSSTQIDMVAMQHLLALTLLECLHLESTGMSDLVAGSLTCLARLKLLSVANNPVGNAALANYSFLSALECLSLKGTRVGRVGIMCLSGLCRLHTLNLYGTGVDDSCLEAILGIASLTTVDLEGTQVEQFDALETLNMRNTMMGFTWSMTPADAWTEP
ncbi:unnamed protein product [Ostreobium quekettii]|uniref:F-box domain-containing protein n=1 Tax=Ostreobium quekettii TaxID=121088 RepID=A0A8S1J7F0_9CHLO|nr:unnamed protein product [Ostreobium quekettii]|eukprot:evm.model.scf_1704.2 EVM.evm.TU.scf_1704.2   scf_1704:10203-12226(+)